MTHDELLKEVIDMGRTRFMNYALRAVVELHKPSDTEKTWDNQIACQECSGTQVSDRSVAYPCNTIKTILKIGRAHV